MLVFVGFLPAQCSLTLSLLYLAQDLLLLLHLPCLYFSLASHYDLLKLLPDHPQKGNSTSCFPNTIPTPSPLSLSPIHHLLQTTVMVRNVRQAHECLEHGETLLFRDEVEYLLDNMKPSQPLLVRCLRLVCVKVSLHTAMTIAWCSTLSKLTVCPLIEHTVTTVCSTHTHAHTHTHTHALR